VPYLSASAVVIHNEEALYQVYAPLPLPLGLYIVNCGSEKKWKILIPFNRESIIGHLVMPYMFLLVYDTKSQSEIRKWWSSLQGRGEVHWRRDGTYTADTSKAVPVFLVIRLC